MISATKTPRGIRNNNPLNLRKSNNPWQGKIVPGSDSAFEQFITMQHGIRAAFINMRTIMRRNEKCTLAKLIATWAPPQDHNNTDDYISRVSRDTGISPNTTISFDNKAWMISLCYAMIKVECGMPVPTSIIETAYEMCLNNNYPNSRLFVREQKTSDRGEAGKNER